MAKKKDWSTALIFGAGMLAMLVALTIWNSATAPRYPAYGPMMSMMRGYSNIDCGSLSDSDLESMGESMMGRMIGDEQLHEQMDAQMRDERTMHILMARMMTGCR